MEKQEYLSQITASLNQEKINFFDDELQIISSCFYKNKIETEQCFNFFKLILQTRIILYKYNLHLIYEPFQKIEDEDLNWQSFKIIDDKQTKLEVFYNRDFSLVRIQDNISALFY